MIHTRSTTLFALALAVACHLGAQDVVALYDFDNQDLVASTPAHASATDLTITDPYMFGGPSGDRWLCLTTDWNNTGGSLFFTVTPAPGKELEFTRLVWRAVTNTPSLSDSVRSATVYANGVPIATVDPLTHDTTHVVDLSGEPTLQMVVGPVQFEIRFVGNPGGQSAYEVAYLQVEAAACVENITSRDRIVWLPLSGMSDYFRALDGVSFVERADGTATLTGAIVNINDPCKRLSMHVEFSGRSDPGDASYPPAGSPKTDGRSLDTSAWRYYDTFTGTFSGQICWEGAVLTIDRRGESFQIGDGANLKDSSFGGSAWFDVRVDSQPTTGHTIPHVDHGDFNFRLGGSCACTRNHQASWNNYGNGTPGCDGVPSLTMSNLPLTGTSPHIELGNSGQAPLRCAIVWNVFPENLFVPLLGGDLLVALPPLAVTPYDVPPGGFTFACSILDDACQVGREVFLQTICIDACGPTGISMSRGLRVVLGDV